MYNVYLRNKKNNIINPHLPNTQLNKQNIIKSLETLWGHSDLILSFLFEEIRNVLNCLLFSCIFSSLLVHIYIGDNFSKSHTHLHKHKDILNASFSISDPSTEHLFCQSECCFPGNVRSTSEFGNLKIIKPFY